MTGSSSRYDPYRNCIEAGIKLFNQYYPPGWVYEVRLKDLDMGSRNANDILAQIASAYGSSYEDELLRIIHDSHADHIIEAQTRYGLIPSGHVDSKQATEMWRDAICALRHPASVLIA